MQRTHRNRLIALLGTLVLGVSVLPLASEAVSPAANIPAERSGTAVVAVAAGVGHACALLTNGRVKCWGYNVSGQLGLGDTANRGDNSNELGDYLSTVDLGTGRRAKTIVAGEYHTCALLDNNTVKCWGSNSVGQLGYGDTVSRGDTPGQMGNNLPTVDLGTGRKAKALSAGGYGTCAILDNNLLKCWGLNSAGQLGIGGSDLWGDGPGEMGNNLPAVDLGTGRKAKSVAVALSHTCALLDNNTVKCWGYNGFGQLGYGDTDYRNVASGSMGNNLRAVDLGTGRRPKAIAAGYGHTCAILDNGSVKCWGVGATGQLGYGDTNARGDAAGEMGNSLPAVNLGSGRKARSISLGTSHTCALLDNGVTKCWGENSLGQLGYGDVNDRGDDESLALLGAVDLGTGRRPTAIAVAGNNSCALLDNRTVKCWGNNPLGQLGLGNTLTRGDGPGEMGDNLPAVNLGVRVRAVSSGTSHSCAILEDRSVQCWGDNSFGQLGYGNTANRGDGAGEMGSSLPTVNLGTGRTAKAVAAGGLHTCAILDNNSVKCWGLGATGQLGYGTTTNRGNAGGQMGDSLPTVDLGAGRSARAITAGGFHTCAILDNGSVKCWGLGSSGQLGYGDGNTRGESGGEMGNNLPAVDLGPSRRARTISAGNSHTCAVLDNGSVKCWGLNDAGQLGSGDTTNRGDGPAEMGSSLQAVNLGTGRKARSVAAGYLSTCALLDNGTAKCWGANIVGQLGYGDLLGRGAKPNDMGNNLPAIDFGTGRKVRSIAVGPFHVCAVLDNFAVKCWGYNAFGQLGYGNTLSLGDNDDEMGDYLPAVAVGGSRRVTAVAASNSTCALLDDGSLRCWGNNDYGQLGTGDPNERGDEPNEMGLNLRPVPMTG